MIERDASKGAWYGDPDLKAEVVAKMKRHRDLDQFIQRTYQSLGEDGAVRGCALGCMIPVWQPVWEQEEVQLAVEAFFNIPRYVADWIDDEFEAQETLQLATDFAVAVVEAIPVGADLLSISPMSRAPERSVLTAIAEAPLVGASE
jgi:hypothetical protein